MKEHTFITDIAGDNLSPKPTLFDLIGAKEDTNHDDA